MSDRLEIIRQKPHGEDVQWLIEEVERLRKRLILGAMVEPLVRSTEAAVTCYLRGEVTTDG